MSDEQTQAPSKGIRRYLGKLRGTETKSNGTMYKIYMDNLDAQGKDGSPNTYYKGALIWADAETGKHYQVRQMSLWVPREGMKAADAAKGYSHFITINLEDNYEVTVLG